MSEAGRDQAVSSADEPGKICAGAQTGAGVKNQEIENTSRTERTETNPSSLSCFRANGTVFYARLLGFKKNAGPLLHAIRHSASIPLLAKPSNAETILKNFYSEQPDRLSCALEMLRMDFLASHRYEGVSSYKYNREFVPEFKKSPIIIE